MRLLLALGVFCLLAASGLTQSLGETADALPLPAGAHRIAGGVTGPIPLVKTPPGYTPEALLAGLEGTAIVTGVINPDGSRRGMRVTRTLGLGLDAKALDAISHWQFVSGTLDSSPVAVFASFAIDFRIPAKQSRWHLTRAAFHPTPGVSEPVFQKAIYPPGAGIGPDAIEEGQLIGASGRTARATVLFDIDERGMPVHFSVKEASADVWGIEAIRLLPPGDSSPG